MRCAICGKETEADFFTDWNAAISGAPRLCSDCSGVSLGKLKRHRWEKVSENVSECRNCGLLRENKTWVGPSGFGSPRTVYYREGAYEVADIKAGPCR